MRLILQPSLWPFIFNQIIKNLAQNYKTRKKNQSKRSKWSDIKYFKSLHFWPKLHKSVKTLYMEIQSFIFTLFLNIFHICTFQWLICTNMKDELNCSYNRWGHAYLLQSLDINFNHTLYMYEKNPKRSKNEGLDFHVQSFHTFM